MAAANDGDNQECPSKTEDQQDQEEINKQRQKGMCAKWHTPVGPARSDGTDKDQQDQRRTSKGRQDRQPATSEGATGQRDSGPAKKSRASNDQLSCSDAQQKLASELLG